MTQGLGEGERRRQLFGTSRWLEQTGRTKGREYGHWVSRLAIWADGRWAEELTGETWSG